MRTTLIVLAIGLVASLLGGPQAASHAQDPWDDLFARDLRDWSRSGEGPSPWLFTSERTVRVAPAHEIYVPEWEFGDGTLRVEYRFKPARQKVTSYRAGLVLRRSLDHAGCKVALGDECGTVTATVIASSDREKVIAIRAPEGLARPIGDWNEIEVKLVGRTVMVMVNGKEAATFERCEVDRGLIALEAEGSEVEFRSVRWKEAGR